MDDDNVQLFASRPTKKRKTKSEQTSKHLRKSESPRKTREAAVGVTAATRDKRDAEQHAQAPEHSAGDAGGVAEERSGGVASTSDGAAAPVIDFRGLGLSEWLCGVCKSLGMNTPTEVQRGCIPAILQGRDVIGLAQTGSGKTAAFALPILQSLAKDPYGVFALVLTPTR